MNGKEMMMNSENKPSVVLSCCWCGIRASWAAAFWGVVLVLGGLFGLLSLYFPLAHLVRYLVPALLLVWGGLMLAGLLRPISPD